MVSFRSGLVSQNSATTHWGWRRVSSQYSDQKLDYCWTALEYLWRLQCVSKSYVKVRIRKTKYYSNVWNTTTPPIVILLPGNSTTTSAMLSIEKVDQNISWIRIYNLDKAFCSCMDNWIYDLSIQTGLLCSCIIMSFLSWIYTWTWNVFFIQHWAVSFSFSIQTPCHRSVIKH